MRIYRHVNALPDSARGTVVAIGNFDGLHRGHQKVIATARDIARSHGGTLRLSESTTLGGLQADLVIAR